MAEEPSREDLLRRIAELEELVAKAQEEGMFCDCGAFWSFREVDDKPSRCRVDGCLTTTCCLCGFYCRCDGEDCRIPSDYSYDYPYMCKVHARDVLRVPPDGSGESVACQPCVEGGVWECQDWQAMRQIE